MDAIDTTQMHLELRTQKQYTGLFEPWGFRRRKIHGSLAQIVQTLSYRDYRLLITGFAMHGLAYSLWYARDGLLQEVLASEIDNDKIEEVERCMALELVGKRGLDLRFRMPSAIEERRGEELRIFTAKYNDEFVLYEARIPPPFQPLFRIDRSDPVRYMSGLWVPPEYNEKSKVYHVSE